MLGMMTFELLKGLIGFAPFLLAGFLCGCTRMVIGSSEQGHDIVLCCDLKFPNRRTERIDQFDILLARMFLQIAP